MSKVYILEPVEIKFTPASGDEAIGQYDVSTLSCPFSDVPNNAVCKIGDSILKYVSYEYDINIYEYLNFYEDDGPYVTFRDDGELRTSAGNGILEVSIYYEVPDEAVNPLSKNITHTDHPYNAVERIRAKLKQKAEQGDSGSSSGGIKGFDAFLIEGYPEQIMITPNDSFDFNEPYVLLAPNYSLENGELGLICFPDDSFIVCPCKDIGSVSGVDPQELPTSRITIAPEKTCHVVVINGVLNVIVTSLDDIVYGTDPITPR